jgi:hypothetical protein
MEFRICEIWHLYNWSGYISVYNREKYVTKMQKDMASLSAALLHDSPVCMEHLSYNEIDAHRNLVHYKNLSRDGEHWRGETISCLIYIYISVGVSSPKYIVTNFLLPSHLISLVSCLVDFRPWRWRWYIPPKRRRGYITEDDKFLWEVSRCVS